MDHVAMMVALSVGVFDRRSVLSDYRLFNTLIHTLSYKTSQGGNNDENENRC